MKIEGIEFKESYICDELSGENVRYRELPSHPKDKGEGVYVVTDGDGLVYVGSYKSGLSKRWVYKTKPVLYHFKDKLLAASIEAGGKVVVLAATLDQIKNQIGCSGNKWVNGTSIEAHLISTLKPRWNKSGNKKKAK